MSVLPPNHVSARDCIPCTSVARTLVDLAGAVPRRSLERALGQAEVLQFFNRRAIEAAIAVRRCGRGVALLRELLGRDDLAATQTRSPPEERLVTLCDRARIPRPAMNVPFTLPDGTAIVIDALWRTSRLAVEVDSRTYHETRQAFASDRHRDRQLTLVGLRPIRFTEIDITRDARKTVAVLRALLTSGDGS